MQAVCPRMFVRHELAKVGAVEIADPEALAPEPAPQAPQPVEEKVEKKPAKKPAKKAKADADADA